MLRLYLRFYLTLVASLILFVIATATLWRFTGGPLEHMSGQGHPGRNFHAALMLLALSIGVAAFPVVRNMSRKLERLQRGVESLGAGDFSARVAVEGHDEVARLARSFNSAAGRIEQLVKAHKALLANASHELRTPLARIRLAMELMKDSVDPRRKSGLEQDIAELDWLVDEILLASRLDAVTEAIVTHEVDLLALAAEECARYEDAHLEGAPGVLKGDARLLRRLLRNLLENAARHGSPPTQVRIARDLTTTTITVWDRGAGVPAAEFENVFRPFYRAQGEGGPRDGGGPQDGSAPRDTHQPGDTNRATDGSGPPAGAPQDGSGPKVGSAPQASAPRSGTGLGLSLVRQIARRHGGEARCAQMDDGRSSFVVTLPL
jgi:signal transduction histidine kinase